MVVVVLFVSASAFAVGEKSTDRIHQHLEAEEKTPCASDTSDFCTHLPLVVIDTGGKEIPGAPIEPVAAAQLAEKEESDLFTKTEEGEEMLAAHIRVVDQAECYNHPGDAAALDSSMYIRIRGNSSREFDKKSYLIRLSDADGSYKNQAVMGMDAHYEWVLYGPYLDKTLIRNYMWYNIAGEIMDYAPNVRFCEVILNGEYRGLYVMAETLTSGENCRLNLTEPIEELNKTGYLLRLDRGSNDPVKDIETFTNYALRNKQAMDIKYPRGGKLTESLAAAITQDFSDFEKCLYSYDYDTDDYGYWHTLDPDSFAEYFIINEFTSNYDAGWLSTYVYKDLGDRFKMVIWDFNSACDNYQDPIDPEHFELQNNVWYFMLMKDEYFTNKIITRYAELRKTFLSEAYLDTYIDEVIEYLGPAVERNFSVWEYTFGQDMLQPAARNPRSHAQAVEQLKTYIHERGEWLDDNIEILKQYSHESKVKKFNH